MFGNTSPRLNVTGFDANDARAADSSRSQMGKMPIVGETVFCRVLAHRRHHNAVGRLHGP
jgi:hypothetical protein